MNPTANPTVNPFARAADPRDAVAVCEDSVRRAGMFAAAGLDEHWPLTTGEVVTILAAFEFDADALDDLIRRRLIPAPGIGENDERDWDASDFLTAWGSLETRGQWKPTPSIHDPKKHPCRIMLEQAREDGELISVVDGGPIRFDARHLIQMLTACDSHEGRAKIAVLLEATLEVDHGVCI